MHVVLHYLPKMDCLRIPNAYAYVCITVSALGESYGEIFLGKEYLP